LQHFTQVSLEVSFLASAICFGRRSPLYDN
jgi:hypothetical protein